MKVRCFKHVDSSGASDDWTKLVRLVDGKLSESVRYDGQDAIGQSHKDLEFYLLLTDVWKEFPVEDWEIERQRVKWAAGPRYTRDSDGTVLKWSSPICYIRRVTGALWCPGDWEKHKANEIAAEEAEEALRKRYFSMLVRFELPEGFDSKNPKAIEQAIASYNSYVQSYLTDEAKGRWSDIPAPNDDPKVGDALAVMDQFLSDRLAFDSINWGARFAGVFCFE